MLGPGHQKDLGWQQGGESGVSGNLNSRLSVRVYGWKVSVALSVTGAERTSPGTASGLSPTTRPHKQSSLPPGLGGNGGGKGSLLRAAQRARHHEGGRTVSIRKSWSHTWC